MSDAPTHVVLYAALSKASDDHNEGSIETQLAAIRDYLEREHPDGFTIVGEFHDDGYSGSKRNRGPDLDAAIQAAARAAAEQGACELWANTPARFGRGTSRPNEARALGELFYETRKQGITLRAVKDGVYLTEEFIGIGSRVAAQYSADLSESVRRARRRDFDKGEFTGGRPRDGYRIQHIHDQDGRKLGREIVFDSPRAEVWLRIFALAREGIPDGQIARRVNKEGRRTRSGRYFDRRSIADGLEAEFYAGRLVRRDPDSGELIVIEGKHPALIPPAGFDALQQKRRRSQADQPPAGGAGHRPGAGRPARNHALATLAVCGNCGERMAAQTSNYVRKDGTRRRYYQCRRSLTGAGNCGAPVFSAELVDGEIVAELDKLLIDFDVWRARIESGQDDDRRRLAAELDRAEQDHAEQARRHDRVQRKWADYVAAGDDERADLVLGAVERERDALVQAERRLTATRDALDSIPEQIDSDALLDFANALQEVVRGRLDRANNSMEEVNAALREIFECFELRETEWAGVQDGRFVYAGGRLAVAVQPVLRESVALALADDWPKLLPTDNRDVPPLRWLLAPARDHPEANSDLIQPVRSQISR